MKIVETWYFQIWVNIGGIAGKVISKLGLFHIY